MLRKRLLSFGDAKLRAPTLREYEEDAMPPAGQAVAGRQRSKLVGGFYFWPHPPSRPPVQQYSMKSKHTLKLNASTSPIRKPVTKLGGQPVWLEEPQWPWSPTFDRPMLFLAQVALDPALFGGEAGRMAYVFVTDPDAYGDLTPQQSVGVPDWSNPFGGENAVIIQPGGQVLNPDLADLRPVATGPTLVRYTQAKGGKRGIPTKVEWGTRQVPGHDPAVFDPNTMTDADLQELKTGGTPALMWPTEFPEIADWALFFQADLGHMPFDLQLDPYWVLYGLLSPDGTTGALMLQTPYDGEFLLTDDDDEAADDETATEPDAAETGAWEVPDTDTAAPASDDRPA